MRLTTVDGTEICASMPRYLQGYFKPRNPEKYLGDPTNIVYRSSWELKVLLHLDAHPDVIAWSSEEVQIPYISPIDGKRHTYFPDFLVQKKNAQGIIETDLVEIKPKKQMSPPKKPKKITKAFLNEVEAWGKNSAKWVAAEEYCRQRGWKFYVLNEDHLNIKF